MASVLAHPWCLLTQLLLYIHSLLEVRIVSVGVVGVLHLRLSLVLSTCQLLVYEGVFGHVHTLLVEPHLGE